MSIFSQLNLQVGQSVVLMMSGSPTIVGVK